MTDVVVDTVVPAHHVAAIINFLNYFEVNIFEIRKISQKNPHGTEAERIQVRSGGAVCRLSDQRRVNTARQKRLRR